MRTAFGAVPLSEPVSEEEGGRIGRSGKGAACVSASDLRIRSAGRLLRPAVAPAAGAMRRDPDRRWEKSERCEGGGFNVRCRTLWESSDERRGPECRHDLSCADDDVRRRRGRLPPMAAAFDTPCRRAPDRPHFAVRQRRPYSECVRRSTIRGKQPVRRSGGFAEGGEPDLRGRDHSCRRKRDA